MVNLPKISICLNIGLIIVRFRVLNYYQIYYYYIFLEIKYEFKNLLFINDISLIFMIILIQYSFFYALFI